MPFDFNSVRPEFVDTDLAEEGKNLDHPAGCLQPDKAINRLPRLGDAVPIIPSSQWKELADAIAAEGGGATKLVTEILDQGNEGSCVGNAETQCDMITQAKQFGRDKVIRLSACSAYQLIGRSPNSGAMVSDAIDAHKDIGILPLDTPENRAQFGAHVMPPRGFRTPRPSGWEATAKLFRADEWFVIQSVEEMFTALLNQIPVVVGRSGHSIVYADLVFKGNDPHVIYVNSWSLDWGFAAGSMSGGFGLDTMRSIRSSSSWAYGLRSIIVPEFQIPK